MKSGILLPVYYGKLAEVADKPQLSTPITSKGGLFSKLKQLTRNIHTEANEQAQNKYFYKPFDDWRDQSEKNSDTENQPPALV